VLRRDLLGQHHRLVQVTGGHHRAPPLQHTGGSSVQRGQLT
jgi:hypothetical protein